MERVLITGAAGRVGTIIAPHLAERHRLRLVDRKIASSPDNGEIEVMEGELLNPELLARAVKDVDVVVHLAANPSPKATWPDLLAPNIDLAWQVFAAANEAGVRRVVYASSSHAAGLYDRDDQRPVDPNWSVRPCCAYGTSKAYGEIAARHFAEAQGMSTIVLRIGWTIARPPSIAGLRQWVSPGDLQQVAGKAVETDQHFGIYYAVSANTRLTWDLSNARRELGFEPQDDGEIFADTVDPNSTRGCFPEP